MKVRGPPMVCPFKHDIDINQRKRSARVALTFFNVDISALDTIERVAMVTSFRSRSPALPDNAVLTTLRSICRLIALVFHFLHDQERLLPLLSMLLGDFEHLGAVSIYILDERHKSAYLIRLRHPFKYRTRYL